MSQLIDLLTAPWAIAPDKLLEMQAIYATHLRGEKINIPEVEARIGRPLASEQQAYTVREGSVGVLSLEGVIAPKANLFMQISGGVSAQLAMRQLEAMRADTRVRAAIVAWDSPGGSVQMIPAFAAELRRLADAKPTVSVSTGVMASAAYWVGSAANAVMVSGGTDMVGSIGVVATHNYSPRQGTVTTEVTAGRYKRMASGNKPLDEEGLAYMQSQVDALYAAFVEAVAEQRGVTADDVLSHMADGRVWIGRQALDQGLADGIATVDDMVEALATNPQKFAARSRASFAAKGKRRVAASAGVAGAAGAQTDADGAPALPGATSDDAPVPPVETLNDERKQAMTTPAEAAAKFAAENPEAAQVLRAEGAAAETRRSADVRAQAMPGHEALIDKLAADGKTTGPEAAMQVLAAERQARNTAAAAFKADAPPAVNGSAPPRDPEQPLSKAEQASKAMAYAAEHGCDFVAAMQHLGYAK